MGSFTLLARVRSNHRTSAETEAGRRKSDLFNTFQNLSKILTLQISWTHQTESLKPHSSFWWCSSCFVPAASKVRFEAPPQGWCVWAVSAGGLECGVGGVSCSPPLHLCCTSGETLNFYSFVLIARALVYWCFCCHGIRIKVASRFVWIWGFSTFECWFISPSW